MENELGARAALVGRAQGPESAARSPAPEPNAGRRPALPGSRWRRWLLAAFVSVVALLALAFWQPWNRLAATGAAKSVAVLPFENRSPEKDSEFFADGVHEDVLASLSYVRELTVIPRMVMMHYRTTTLRPRELGAELRVAYVVSGTVRRSGNSVRVTGQLIETRTEESKWTWQRDYDLTAAKDVMAIQREMAQAIAGELKAAITPQAQRLIARRPTENVAAYDAYLKARTIRDTATSASQRRYAEGEALSRKAVEFDGQFAEAWAELARALSALFQFGFDQTPALIARTIEAIETARRLSPDSPDVLLADAEVYYRLGRDYGRATADLERVLRLQPGTPEVYTLLGVVQRRQGKWREALASTLKAVEIDPRYLHGWQNVRNSWAFARRFDEEIAAYRRMVEFDPGIVSSGRAASVGLRAGRPPHEFRAWLEKLSPAELNSSEALTLRTAAAVLRGDYDEVIRLEAPFRSELIIAWALAAKGDLAGARKRLEPVLIETRRRLKAEPANAALWSKLGQIEAVLGQADDARRAVNKAVEMTPDARDAIDGPTFRHDRAVIWAWTGGKAEAIAELGRLLQVPGTQTFTNIPLTVAALRRDPRYSPLWGDPRFEALLNDPKNNQPLF